MNTTRRTPCRTLARSVAVTAMAAATLAASVAWAPPSVAQTGADYHLEAFGDPLDFSNAEDLTLNTTEAIVMGTSNRSISGSQLHFDTNGIFRVDAVWPGYPTGIPHGYEGGRVPIDTSRYTRLIIRMNAPEGAPLGLRWYSCLEQSAACTGGQPFIGRGGWQSYDLTIGEGADGSLPVAWSGPMLGLSVVGNVTGHFDIDYIRLVPAGSTDTGELVGGATANVFPADRLDFATAAGNAWDLDSAADVRVSNLQPGWNVANGRLSGCTLGTAGGRFPLVDFALPGGRSIDAARFKTLTFDITYEGTFNTRPVPGGGAFARVFWNDETGARRPTQAIHLYPNHQVVQVRLDDARATFRGVEAGKGATGKPWSGLVTKFAINPSDDKAPRCFTIGRVMLTADEPAGAALGDTRVATPTPLAASQPAPKIANTAAAKSARARTQRGKSGRTKRVVQPVSANR